MAATDINVRIDSEIAGKAQVILNDLGLDMSTAINLFLRQVVYKEAIPFAIDKAPNPATKKSRKDLRGSLKGKVWMAYDFDAPLEEMQGSTCEQVPSRHSCHYLIFR